MGSVKPLKSEAWRETRILYEDNHLLVVEKPVNMLSQSNGTGDPDLLTILKEDVKLRYNKPGNAYLGLVHRLDRPVGGVMVFARTSKAASRLSEQIRNGKFRKTYLAVINGCPANPEGYLEHFLVKDSRSNTVKTVPLGYANAKRAILYYKVLKTANRYCLVEIDLKTGRPHQIRVQFAAIGHAIYGDRKYGAYEGNENEQLALWSTRIKFEHPTLSSQMVFDSLPPDAYPWNLFGRIELVRLNP